jgi:hypothetical protein
MAQKSYDFYLELFNKTTEEIENNYVSNPITFDIDDKCILMNTKKIAYYTHTYNPSREFEILRGLQSQLNIPADYLDRFDNKPKEGCCNVISITLYFEQCVVNKRFETFINGINRTVKNVRKNLPNWIVRLYLDKSVYDCFTKLDFNVKNNDKISKPSRDNFISYIKMFDDIVSSPNVELYTFNCNKTSDLARTRIHRFLPMIDPNVNLYIIREADGFVSNLDCHNIKIYEKSNRLFYLVSMDSYDRHISIDGIINRGSYSAWLNIYKLLFDNEYFKTHQNMYDLLAGLFACKLKLKPKYFMSSIQALNKQLNHFLALSQEERLSQYSGLREDTNNYTDKDFKLLFNIGFDEMLLLKLFKDMISIRIDNIDVDNNKIKEPSVIEYINSIRDSIFFADNIKTISFNIKATEYDKINIIINLAENKMLIIQIIGILKLQKILKLDFKLGDFNLSENITLTELLIIVDGFILSHIREDCNEIFNIAFKYDSKITYATELLNMKYDSTIYDKYYDTLTGGSINYKEKYLKYKNKYLSLKNSNI